jgi:hypothetical protein
MLQTVLPELQVPQSASVKQALLQNALTHSWPAPHSEFAWHWGTRDVDGWHTPARHTSWVLVQSLLLVQSTWQRPLMQLDPAAHWLSWTQPLVGDAAGAQWPDTQASPVPQSLSTLHADWQAPATQTPPVPHCESAVHGLDVPLAVHEPFLHTWPAEHEALVVQLAVLPAGVQVWFWHVVPEKPTQSASVLQMPVSLHVPLLQ